MHDCKAGYVDRDQGASDSVCTGKRKSELASGPASLNQLAPSLLPCRGKRSPSSSRAPQLSMPPRQARPVSASSAEGTLPPIVHRTPEVIVARGARHPLAAHGDVLRVLATASPEAARGASAAGRDDRSRPLGRRSRRRAASACATSNASTRRATSCRRSAIWRPTPSSPPPGEVTSMNGAVEAPVSARRSGPAPGPLRAPGRYRAAAGPRQRGSMPARQA